MLRPYIDGWAGHGGEQMLLLSFILGRSVGGKRGIIRIFVRIIANGDENRAELFVGGTQHVPPPGQDSLVHGVCLGGGAGSHPEG